MDAHRNRRYPWNTSLTALRARCTTCHDAFDRAGPATLATQLQSIIDQGASDGDFNAQQSITESVYEYVNLAATASVTYDAAKPGIRYKAIVPHPLRLVLLVARLQGPAEAFHNNGDGRRVETWSAGDVLLDAPPSWIAPSIRRPARPSAPER